jgi:hypothetical protein
VPIPYRKKAPRIKNWPDLRITFETLERYFIDQPNGQQNIGVLTGDPSGGLVDVDIDCPEAWALADDYLPQTDAVFGRASAGRGHRLYRVSSAVPPYIKLDDPMHDNACLLELRGTGHQTVMPGSTHPSGEPIVWLSPPPTAGPWAPDPAVVDAEELERALKRLGVAALLLRYYPHEGQRHDFWLPLSGALLRRGWSVTEVEEFLTPVAMQAGDEELADRLRTIRDTAAKLQAGELVTGLPTLSEYLPEKVIERLVRWLDLDVDLDVGRDVAPVLPAFPLAVLPEPYRTFVTQAARSLDVPPDFVALPTLAAVSTALGRRWCVEVKGDWIEYPLLWVAIVGGSGTRKSQALKKALAPIYALDSREHQRYQEARKAWEQARTKQGGGAARDSDEPQRRHVFASDATIEAVMALLPHTPALLLTKDELLHLTTAMDRYAKKSGGGGAGDRQSLLSLWSLAPCKVVRKTQPPILVEKPYLVIAGGIQPDNLDKFGESDDPDGLVARFLWAYPDASASRWTEEVVDTTVEGAYQRAVEALADDNGSAGGERRVPLTADARRRFAAYHDELTHRIEVVRGRDPAHAAALSKLQGYTPRLALVLAAMRWSSDGGIPPSAPGRGGDAVVVIDIADMEGAIELAEYFAAHHQRTLTALRRHQATTAARSPRVRARAPAPANTPTDAHECAAIARAHVGGDADDGDDGDDDEIADGSHREQVLSRLEQELQRNGEMPRAELLRRVRCSAQVLDEVIAVLERDGRVRCVPRTTRGRPAMVVRWQGAPPSSPRCGGLRY